MAEQLHSIFIRGSIPRGAAVVGISDVDMFAIVKDSDRVSRHWIDELGQVIERMYQFRPQLDLELYGLDDVATNPRLRMVMKTQSLCLYGDDLRASIRSFKPGPDMMLAVYWLRHDIEDSLHELERATGEQEIRSICRRVTKVILRCGFEIVMEKEQRYTNSLYYCYRSFSRHYPQHEPSMRACPDMFLDPVPEKGRLTELLQSFGAWLIHETARLYGELMKP